MGTGKGVALVLIIRKTDFHAYYTNDFWIFDVSAGVGRTQKPSRRLVLSHLVASLSDGIISVTSDSAQDAESPCRRRAKCSQKTRPPKQKNDCINFGMTALH